jgi:predicted transcriptional regulator of viral defense system
MYRICAIRAPDNPTIQLIREHFGERPFTVPEAVDAGASRRTLYRLREHGALEAPAPGVLQLAGAGMGMLSSLAVVSARVPAGTICLNSALSYWDLSDEIPEAVHIAVPRGAHRPIVKEPFTKVHVFDAGTFGLERRQARTDADEPFWIYSAERSVVDAMRMARWIGRDVGLHALRRYMSRPRSSPARLVEIARELGGAASLRPSLEALLS